MRRAVQVKAKPRRRWLERLVLCAIAAAILWLLFSRVGTSPGQSETPRAESPAPAPENPEDSAEHETSAAREIQDELAPQPEVVLRGRCVEVGSSEPLPGFGVLLSDGEHSIEAESDADGRFHAPWPAGRGARVEVRPRPGWSAGSPARDLEPEELHGAREILLHVIPDPRKRIVGRVVDERTGRGVHALSIRISRTDADKLETVTTDASGDFATSESHASAELAIEVADDDPSGRALLGSFRVSHDATLDAPGGSHVLAVAIGPSSSLRIAGGEGIALRDWRARIVERRGDPMLCGALLATPGGFVLDAERRDVEEVAWSWRGLRHGEVPWLRYPTVEREPSAAFTAFLELETRDGTLRGEARLDATVGELTEALDVSVEPSATLLGRLDGDLASEGPADVRLWLQREAEPSSWLGPWIPAADGAFQVRGLALGSYRLAVRAPLRTPVDVRFQLAPGPFELGTIALEPIDRSHAIEGSFECDRGHGAGVVRLVASSLEGPLATRSLLVRVGSGKPGLPVVERFEVEDLPAGGFVLRPDAVAGEHRFSPDEVRLVTPAPNIAFRCRGGAPEERVRVSVRAPNDEPIVEFAFELGSLRLLPFTWPESRPVERWYSWPRATAARWTVFVPGFQPAQGDSGDLERGGVDTELSVDLERGFAARIALRDGVAPAPGAPPAAWRRLPPVCEVAVHADGEIVGTTDENGELVLGLPSAPEKIELFHVAWRALELRVGDLGGGVSELVVFLEPRAR